MIQILTYSGKESSFGGDNIEVKSLHSPKSLDEFDINIISLADEDMWTYQNHDNKGVDNIQDLHSLSEMIRNSHKTKIIILIPQNVTYYYFYTEYSGYMMSCELKNMIQTMICYIMAELYAGVKDIRIHYENTSTKIGNEYVDAAFYFKSTNNALLTSEKSNKPTAINCGDLILASLDLKNYNQIINFLKALGLIQYKQNVPIWMEDIKMFDDTQQFKIIEENNQTIRAANDNIACAMEKINKNNEYKSILYTTGEELVKVVFEILESLFGCDLSQFEDKKKEDFLFEKNGLVFIGEIKGVNHNVKSENISQLDVHYQGYLEENEDKDQDNVKAILIMNHQKNKALNVREPVHEKQINLAKRNGSLIVESITLLRLFERYLAGGISQEECLELLKSNTGLLEI